MKKSTFLLIGILFATLVMSQDRYIEWAKEISKEFIKEGFSDYHGQIVKEANKKWGNDYEMVSYEIKNQCEALYKMLHLEKPERMTKDTFLEIQTIAMSKWGEFNEENKIIKMDWEMALYETQNQIKAYLEIF